MRTPHLSSALQRVPSAHVGIRALLRGRGSARGSSSAVPLVGGDALDVHPALRSEDWGLGVGGPENRAARSPPPAVPPSYPSACAGWKCALTPPQTIWVW